MNEWDSIVGSRNNYGSSYGSCVHSITKTTTNFKTHVISETDTVQGIALKYGISTAELRQVNKLYSSDSLFLRRDLRIPVSILSSEISPQTFTNKPNNTVTNTQENINAIPKNKSSLETNVKTGIKNETNKGNFEAQEVDAKSFLQKLDSQILAGKNAIKELKVEPTDEYDLSKSKGCRAKMLTNNEYHKNHQKSMFSHSPTKSNHLFEL